MSFWRARARARIAELVKDLPADATLEQRRKVLRGKGYPAHKNTNWGRKMWGQEVRYHLARHGAVFGPNKAAQQFRFPDDIYFPFREERDAQG